MACGTKDSLLPASEHTAEFLKLKGITFTYYTSDGGHEWNFWENCIYKAIYEWLPLEESEEGIHSGNIGK